MVIETSLVSHVDTVFLRFSAPGHLPIFEVFGGALNRAGALNRRNTVQNRFGKRRDIVTFLFARELNDMIY